MSPDDRRHGTNAGHAAGCRMSCCGAAKLRYDKRRRWEALQGNARKVSAIGATRRIQALRALGWSVPRQARECGLDHRQLYSLKRYPTCYRKTHDVIADMYERLAMHLPPTSTQSEKHAVTKTRRCAARNDWPPPLAWSNIDDPDETPRGWQYEPATRLETFTELADREVGVSELCRHLGLTRAALQKWAANNGLSAEFRAACGREHNYSTSAQGGAA